MRVLLDTNVLIAAFIARGTCSELLEHCVRTHTIVSSRLLFQELNEKLSSKFGFSRQEIREVTELLHSRMVFAEPVVMLNPPICRDPDDDVVLATAQAGRCACIVTGDKDLLVLQQFQNIPILSPSDFWRYEHN